MKNAGSLFKGTGKVLANIPSQQITPSGVTVTSSGGYDLVCSYNWIKTKDPTVYVPGDPPRYVRPQLPLSLPKDSQSLVGQNSDTRIPKYPFEVVFRAMEVMNPDCRLDDVDVLINRHTLRKLLDFARGRCQDEFRVNLFGIANTMIVERWEAEKWQLIEGRGNYGWGHSFEVAVTQPGSGLVDITGHHRVLRYDFGGLNCAVRFEVDACCDDSTTAAPEEVRGSATDVAMKHAELSEALSGLQIQEPPLYPEPEGCCGIRVIPRGSGIPHIAAAEIKSMGKLKTPETMLPQLWFGRTKNLIRGVHERGVFHTIHVSSVEDDLQSWETGEQNQRDLRKVAALLSQLRDLVMKSEERACVVVCQKQTKPVLRVFATTQRKTALPQDLRDKF